jgi:hypothetical protein
VSTLARASGGRVAPHPGHERIIAAAVPSPSAHNAQPWRLAPLPDGASYELHYDAADYLPYDPEDRDAGLAMFARKLPSSWYAIPVASAYTVWRKASALGA